MAILDREKGRPIEVSDGREFSLQSSEEFMRDLISTIRQAEG